LAKYDGAGNRQWVRQFGTGAYEIATGVSTDGRGSVYVAGTSNCFSPCSTSLTPDGAHAFVVRYRNDSEMGDFNNDGTVDAADYTVWRNDLGTKYIQSDYDVWRAHFGRTARSGSIHEIVPEPNSAALGFVALACLIVLRAKNNCRVGYFVSCAAPWREST
jgi:hypothetical protein